MVNLKLEFSKIISNKALIIILLFFIILTFYSVSVNIDSYRNFLKEKDFFIEYEKNKVKQYTNYNQYGGYGFRVFVNHSPLCIFFNDSIDTIECNIDSREIINVISTKRGKAIFNSKNYNSPSHLIVYFGSFIMLFLGFSIFKNYKIIKFYKTKKRIIHASFGRLIISIVFFMLIFSGVFLFAIIRGMRFSIHEIKVYLSFSSYVLLLFVLFYLIGLIVFFLLRDKEKVFTISIIVGIVLLIFLPELWQKYINHNSQLEIDSIRNLNIRKLNEVMSLERRAINELKSLTSYDSKRLFEINKKYADIWMNEGYLKNNELENKYLNRIIKVFKRNKSMSLVFPTIFYGFLANELSVNSFDIHHELLFYIIDLRDKFVKFYMSERYKASNNKVKSFVNSNENLFVAKIKIPHTFKLGFLVLFFYIIILVIFLYVKVRSIIKIRKLPNWIKDIKPGVLNFKLFEGDQERDIAFDQFSFNEGYTCLGKICLDDIGVTGTKNLLSFLAAIRDVDIKDVNANLNTFRFTETVSLINKSKTLKNEYKEIILSVILAGSPETIIICDVMKNEDKEIDINFRRLLYSLLMKNKNVVYLSSQMIETTKSKSSYLKNKSKKSEKLILIEDIGTITFR